MSFIHDIYEFQKSFRHIEKLTLRCVHLKNAIEFNETCLNNGIFPNYCHIFIYIYIADRKRKQIFTIATHCSHRSLYKYHKSYKNLEISL